MTMEEIRSKEATATVIVNQVSIVHIVKEMEFTVSSRRSIIEATHFFNAKALFALTMMTTMSTRLATLSRIVVMVCCIRGLPDDLHLIRLSQSSK